MEYYNFTGNISEDKTFWDFKGRVESVDNWFLMTTPLPVLTIWVAYMLVILKVGPDMMKSRPPLKMKNILGLYNLVQVLGSLYLFNKGMEIIKPNGLMKSSCSAKDNILEDVAAGIHCYLIAKISELLDTVFFVLRKKQNQVTFLHVYHHSVMILFTWISLKYDPTYSVVFLGTLNSFVHIVMYTYYGLSAFPALAKYLWWKKYITVLQLVQFFLVLIHAIVNYAFGCPPSPLMFYIIMSNGALFIYLFGDFYIKSYLNRSGYKNKEEVYKELKRE